MDLKLSEEEYVLLRRLLESDLGELRVELRRTEDAAYRAQLQSEESCLRLLIERLQADGG